jgi:hypothetical protein
MPVSVEFAICAGVSEGCNGEDMGVRFCLPSEMSPASQMKTADFSFCVGIELRHDIKKSVQQNEHGFSCSAFVY